MSQSVTNGRWKNIAKTAIWAAASIGLYSTVFANEAAVTKYYTAGSYFAALPIATALVFSVIHGGFASQCYETLGIAARKSTTTVSVTQEKRPEVRKDQRARLEIR